MKTLYILASAAFLLLAPFTYSANPVPFLSQPLVPASVAPGGATFTLTVNGTGFVSASVVNFNGKPQPTTFLSQGKLEAQISSSEIAQAGTAVITVSSGGVASNTVFLPVLAPMSSVQFTPNTGIARGLDIGNVIEADFNGDGKPDLAYTTGDNLTYSQSFTVGIALGNGDGTFKRAGQHTTLEYPEALAGDINGDGKVDLIILDYGRSTYPTLTISVFLGNGDGTFQQRKDYLTTISAGGGVLADFNGDGNLDIAFSLGSEIAVLPGNGDGTFGNAIISRASFGGCELAVGDFNNDGKLDLASACFSQTTMWAALGNGDGSFQNAITLYPNGLADGLVAADFNGDGILDLATSSQTGVSVLLGLGDGNFQAGIISSDVPDVTYAIVTADFNGDGKLDLLLAHHNESHISYLLGNGDGTFTLSKVFNRPLPVALALGDFNGDGLLDFAFVLSNESDNGNSSVNVDLQKAP